MTTPLVGEPARVPVTRRAAAIAGATGLIGSALADSLRRDGWRVVRLTRRAVAADDVAWDPANGRIDAARLAGVDVVVNLAGESIDQRWTAERKRRIRDSRVRGTTLLAREIAALTPRPRVLINASAVGYYGDRGDELLDERSAPGSDFLARVCVEWEGATAPASAAGIRVVCTRTGLVLAAHGGALDRMLLPFRLGLGGRVGSGQQWMSWISLDDQVRAIRFAIDRDELSGPLDLTSPTPVRNEEFTRVLGEVLGRPTLLTVPAFAFELMFGEMGRALLLGGQRALPSRLLAAGFSFAHPSLTEALRAVLG